MSAAESSGVSIAPDFECQWIFWFCRRAEWT